MNFTKLILAFGVVSVAAFLLIDMWVARYALGLAEIGAGIMVGVDIVCLYIIAVGFSEKPKAPKPPPEPCMHDWQKHEFMENRETCILCKADRGRN